MATRPVFLADTKKEDFVDITQITFDWFPGFSVKQKQRSIESLHANILQQYPYRKVLEISSKSNMQLGISLSAFNLMIKIKNEKEFSVETAFQSSKVFENGGPYLDLFDRSSREAKKDDRLKKSGRLLYFQYFQRKWPLEPKTLFYDWLYINALALNKSLGDEVLQYDAFTDIEFNPENSINCQARSAALFVALNKLNTLESVLSSTEKYLEVLGKDEVKVNKHIDTYEQMTFFND